MSEDKSIKKMIETLNKYLDDYLKNEELIKSLEKELNSVVELMSVRELISYHRAVSKEKEIVTKNLTQMLRIMRRDKEIRKIIDKDG